MEQMVRVKETHPDGTATVIHVRESACSGDCHKCSGCGAAKEAVLFTADNPIGAEPGDVVVLHSESAPVLKAAAVLYMLPLVLFFMGYALGAIWGLGGWAGCGGFIAGVAIAMIFDRKFGKMPEKYTILSYVKDTKRG